MPPSSLTCTAQTFSPVSALAAKTQPSLEPTYMHPSEMTGVPVKSPEPPADDAENDQAGASRAASTRPIVFSAGCVLVFDWSWPIDGHSPPACLVGAHAASPAEDGSESRGSRSAAPASTLVSFVNPTPSRT